MYQIPKASKTSIVLKITNSQGYFYVYYGGIRMNFFQKTSVLYYAKVKNSENEEIYC